MRLATCIAAYRRQQTAQQRQQQQQQMHVVSTTAAAQRDLGSPSDACEPGWLVNRLWGNHG
jgi:hypothetical protein